MYKITIYFIIPYLLASYGQVLRCVHLYYESILRIFTMGWSWGIFMMWVRSDYVWLPSKQIMDATSSFPKEEKNGNEQVVLQYEDKGLLEFRLLLKPKVGTINFVLLKIFSQISYVSFQTVLQPTAVEANSRLGPAQIEKEKKTNKQTWFLWT